MITWATRQTQRELEAEIERLKAENEQLMLALLEMQRREAEQRVMSNDETI